jgi:polysaccharide biosynthesis transport protein
MSKNKNTLGMFSHPGALSKEAMHDQLSVIHKPHFSPPLASPEQAKGLNFVLHGLRRWWMWALPLGLLLGGGAASAVYLLFKPSYEAVACLKIEVQPRTILPGIQEDRDSSRSFVNTQIVLLRHPVVLGPVVAEPEIAAMPEITAQPDPVKWLSKQISVRAEGDSELYDVAYAAGDPKAAAKVVNTLLKEYFRQNGQEYARRNEKVIEILKEERKNHATNLSLLRNSVGELTKQATGKDPFAGTTEPTVIVNHPLLELQNHLATAEVEQEVLKARIKALQETTVQQAPLSKALLENKIETNPQVLQYKDAITELQFQLQSLDSYSKRGAKDPAHQQISQQIQRNEKLLAQLRKDLQKQGQIELQSTTAAKRDDQIAALQADFDSRRITVELLRKRYVSEMKDVKQTSGDTLQLRFKQGELEREEKIYDLISERIVKLETEKGAPERVLIVQEAIAPNAPIEVFPYRNLLLAALAGLALPFGLALGLEKLIIRVSDASNLENTAHLPVIGEIARLPSRRRLSNSHRSLRRGLDMRMFEESINSLRTTLMLAEDLRDLRVLAVTSATTHEGKTSVAVQLAMSMARSTNKPTLLIDGDMRSPNLHEIFEVPLEPGLTKILEGKASIAESIVATSCSVLDLLPAGELVCDPHQLLGNGEPAALLQSIPDKYRYVIIDTPPVLAASESLMLAAMADASLVCVLRDVSRIEQIKKAYQRLMIAGGKPVGLVLNGVPTKTYANNYGNYAYANQ